MDLQYTPSHAPVRDAELPQVRAFEPPAASTRQFAHPDADVRMAERQRKEKALGALETQITELWGHINAATAHFLALVAEFDRREGWAQHGMASCAQWLNWQCGIGAVAAREKVRTARALEALPKIQAAFGEGRLSYSKVRALTRVAEAETEDTLLHIALNGTAAHVERTVRGFRRVKRDLERDEAEAMHERRYLDWRQDSDGSVRIEARLTPEVGELLRKALEAAHAQLDQRGGDADTSDAVPASVSAETSRTRPALPPCWTATPENVSAETPPRSAGQRRVDALEHIVQRFLAGAGSRSTAGAHEVVVHIAHDALCDVPESSGAEFDNGRPLAVETTRRLGCDGALVGVVEGAKGEPLAVGRRTRAVPPAIRRALRVRDGGCRFPGCDRSRYVHAHHIKHWADGGETALDNLVTLCSFHHRLVHEGGYGVHVDGGEIKFTRPDGRVIPAAGKEHGECFRGNTSAANGAQRVEALNTARGLTINAGTARCRWRGERMDYDIAIDALCRQAGYQ
ncbi:MAG: DUF222 domain-containing protein [Gammaproteobacteria bacterium]|nr:DUF222 domain-containing protein [Gammaproteobacteria bacterium]MYD02599.1 DUF222 domain-containing protein [Gammaproteobacteria bacterium]MYI26197.1 DUF222 domain-containing protein [Gammaproteobacteria bacterium]